MNSRHLAVVLAALLPAACSSPSSSTRAIAGRVDTSQFQLQNASAVAVSSSQHVYRAPVAADGSFSIAVPVGSTYSLHFANATSDPRMLDSFATLAPLSAQGTRTHWFHVTEGGTIQLGLVGVPHAAKSGGADDGTTTDPNDDSSSDASEGEHDDDEVCDLSGGSDDQDVDGEHDLMQENDSDHDGLDDSADTQDDRGACTDSHDDGDDCALSGEQEQENEHESDDACAATPGATPVPGSTPAAP